MRVVVTATNVSGSGVSTSTQTALVPAPFTATGATPPSAPQGRHGLVVQVAGTGIVYGATVAFSGTGVSVTATNWVSSTRIDVTVSVTAAAAATARDIIVTNPSNATATATGAFTVTVPALSLSTSVLGYSDAARDGIAPYALGWGSMIPGTTKEVGTVGSGQAVPGDPALRIDVTSDTDYVTSLASTTWSDGVHTAPASILTFKHHGVAEAWTALAVGGVAADAAPFTPLAPAARTHDYDLAATVPAGQAPGAYSATMTITVVPQP